MKMKELEERTGVGREAIRFYIREGLLPEPDRPKRNVATYSDAHVLRLKAIRRLQEERFLPLAVIKALLSADEGAAAIDAQAFPALDHLLQDRLGVSAPEENAVSISTLQQETGLTDTQIEGLETIGMITIRRDQPEPYVRAIDASITRLWAQLNSVGFTEDRGFTSEAARIYVEFVEWLTKAEVKLFYQHLADKLSVEDAAQIGERGVTLVNEVIGQLRTKLILRELRALNAPEKNDEKSEEKPDDKIIKVQLD